MERDVKKEFDGIMKQVSDLLKYVNKRSEEVFKEQSECDLAITDILHVIELHKLNASKNSKLIRILRDVTGKRRDIKNEISYLDKIKNSLPNSESKLAESKEKHYTFRTDYLAELGFKKGSKIEGDI